MKLNDVAVENFVPVATANVAKLLSMLVLTRQPSCVLELGTAYGVSTRHLLEALPENGKVISLDLSSERQQVAYTYLKNAGFSEENFVLVCKDFREKNVLENLHDTYGTFDFVFIDAAKAQYGIILEVLEPMLSDHAMLVFDNVFLNGWVISGHYPNHRQKTMFTRMNDFLNKVSKNEKYYSSLIPFDDGCLVMIKR